MYVGAASPLGANAIRSLCACIPFFLSVSNAAFQPRRAPDKKGGKGPPSGHAGPHSRSPTPPFFSSCLFFSPPDLMNRPRPEKKERLQRGACRIPFPQSSFGSGYDCGYGASSPPPSVPMSCLVHFSLDGHEFIGGRRGGE